VDALASQIAYELDTKTHCAVYEEALSRIFPISDKGRVAKIKNFAIEHGLHLAFYREGLCAILVKAPRH
jgi:hypothetical protein